jgi:hypothetical protein
MIDEQRPRLGAIEIPPAAQADARAALELAVGESFVAGFRLVTLGSAGLALASALCAWFMIDEQGALTPDKAR